MLGIHVSERTVSRYLPRRPPQPDEVQRWITFLRNHRDAIAAMDLFVVPTVAFRLLYVSAIDHAQRRILHFEVTELPAATWAIQQLREAFPVDTAPRHLIFDRDSIFFRAGCLDDEVVQHSADADRMEKSLQNGVAERWVGSVRRELLDHVVVFNERHLRGSYANTSATTTMTAHTSDWGRRLQQGDRCNVARTKKPMSSRCLGSVGCFIATSGA